MIALHCSYLFKNFGPNCSKIARNRTIIKTCKGPRPAPSALDIPGTLEATQPHFTTLPSLSHQDSTVPFVPCLVFFFLFSPDFVNLRTPNKLTETIRIHPLRYRTRLHRVILSTSNIAKAFPFLSIIREKNHYRESMYTSLFSSALKVTRPQNVRSTNWQSKIGTSNWEIIAIKSVEFIKGGTKLQYRFIVDWNGGRSNLRKNSSGFLLKCWIYIEIITSCTLVEYKLRKWVIFLVVTVLWFYRRK